MEGRERERERDSLEVEQREKLSRVLLQPYTILNFEINLVRVVFGDILMWSSKLV